MSVEEIMTEYGFRLSAGCSGKAAYTKNVKHNDKRAYLSLTIPEGEGFPQSVDEPVLVTVFDLKSGEPMEPGEEYSSLSSYLETLKE